MVTVFGIEMDEFFWTVTELDAAPTEHEGEYVAPDWDGAWYMLEYAPEQSEWFPLICDDWYEEGDQTFTVYSAEITYYENGSEDAQDAILEVIIDDETGEVTDYAVTTYETFYKDENDDEGYVQFSRDSFALQPGDRIQFWTYAYHKTDSEQDEWVETSEILTLAQDPAFSLEELSFKDDRQTAEIQTSAGRHRRE